MGPIGGGGLGGSQLEGGGVGGGPSFSAPPQSFSGPFSRNDKYISGILSSSPADWHPFCTNWVKGGDCVNAYKSEPRAHGCGRGLCKAKGATYHSKLAG